MEFWRSQDPGDIAIKLTPGDRGRLEVYLDGRKIFDRKEDGGYPNFTKVNELKLIIAETIEEFNAATVRKLT
jgi:predicted Rdx family selenoprotein